MTTSLTGTLTGTLTGAPWAQVLGALHLRALPQSSYVPIDVWLADQRTPTRLLHLVARGTQVRLAAYDRSDLTTLLLRAECDCEEHRQAGATGRPVLRPGAVALSEAVYDGAERAGWRGVAAGLLRRDEAAPLLEELHGRLALRSSLTAAV